MSKNSIKNSSTMSTPVVITDFLKKNRLQRLEKAFQGISEEKFMKLTFAQVNDLVSSKFKSTDAEKCSLKFRDFQMTRDFPAYAKLIETWNDLSVKEVDSTEEKVEKDPESPLITRKKSKRPSTSQIIESDSSDKSPSRKKLKIYRKKRDLKPSSGAQRPHKSQKKTEVVADHTQEAQDTDDDETLNGLVKSLSFKDDEESHDSDSSSPHPIPQRRKCAIICDLLASKQLQHVAVISAINDLDLKLLLISSLQGLSVVRGYQVANFLKNPEKKSLTQIVVDWILLRYTRVTQEIFLLLRRKIADCFPKEKEAIYYVSPKDHERKKTRPKGKLYARVQNRKEWMVEKGLMLEDELNEYKELEEQLERQDIELSEEILASIEWLSVYQECEDGTDKHWTNLYEYRRDLLKSKKYNTLQSYYEKFPVLQQKTGYKLIDIDYKKRFPDIDVDLVQNWEVFAGKVTKLLKSRRIRDRDASSYQVTVLKPKSTDARNIALMLCLPTLVAATHKITINNKLQKPSAKQAREELLLHVETSKDLLMLQKERVEAARKAKVSVQPYIAYIGDFESGLGPFYVVIDNFCYKFTTFLRALDVIFKSFWALDVDYPPGAKHIYILLEKAVFGLNEADQHMPTVTEFLQQLESMP